MVIAIVIVPCDFVGICRSFPQVQVAISVVIPVGLVVLRAAEPPRRGIFCHPRQLLRRLRVHGVTCTTSTTILRPRNINNPVWCPQRLCRFQEALPVLTARWREKLCASWATVLLCRLRHIKTIKALHHGTSRVGTVHGHACALACRRTSWSC